MNTVPAVFGPQPSAPWWNPEHASAACAGWTIAAALVAGIITWLAWSWLSDRWEITCPWRITRRWYGTHARVQLRAEVAEFATRNEGRLAETLKIPDLYIVLEYHAAHTSVPWLLVCKANQDDPRYQDEDSVAFWSRVDVFTPCTVRRFRPHLHWYGRVRVPILFRQVPVAGAR